MTNFLNGFAAAWNLGLLLVAVVTLGWFMYWVFLRKLIRAKRINSAHMKRLMRESAERSGEGR
jgi:hypothetical protein